MSYSRVREALPASSVPFPSVSRQISQESTVPTQTSAGATPAGNREQPAELGGREHRVDPQPGPAADHRVVVRGRSARGTTAAVRTSCQPITGPAAVPSAGPRPRPTRAGWTEPRRDRSSSSDRVDCGQAPLDRGQHAGPDQLGVLLDPPRTRVRDADRGGPDRTTFASARRPAPPCCWWCPGRWPRPWVIADSFRTAPPRTIGSRLPGTVPALGSHRLIRAVSSDRLCSTA